MRVTVNGEEREFPADATVADLVETLPYAPEQIAIAINRTIARREEWPTRRLADGDNVEIVRAVGGG